MTQPTFFVRIHGGVVVDVCTTDPDAGRFVVIDEDRSDVSLDAGDGTEFTAHVYEVKPTAPHFDPEQVVGAIDPEAEMANGMTGPGR